MRRLFRQFSFPGGIPSHAAPETPGSIHEGGELGYALAHAFGAAFDNPDLIVAAVVGDGEAETGPLAASWHCNKFLNPAQDGAVLPILHLNGYKIANPTLLARIPESELDRLLRGYGWDPHFVAGDEPGAGPPGSGRRPSTPVLDRIAAIQHDARRGGRPRRPAWPMIVLRTPKGWTGPKEVDGHRGRGVVAVPPGAPAETRTNPDHLRQLEEWLRSYRPEELFDDDGRLRPQLAALAPEGERRMGANPHANGGAAAAGSAPARLPGLRRRSRQARASTTGEATRVLGRFLRDVMAANARRRPTSGCSGPTRPPPTASTPSSR